VGNKVVVVGAENKVVVVGGGTKLVVGGGIKVVVADIEVQPNASQMITGEVTTMIL
jgi:hypothetical protein